MRASAEEVAGKSAFDDGTVRGDEMEAAFGTVHQGLSDWILCGQALANLPSYSELNSWMLTHRLSLVIYAHDEISIKELCTSTFFFQPESLAFLSTRALSDRHLQLMVIIST